MFPSHDPKTIAESTTLFKRISEKGTSQEGTFYPELRDNRDRGIKSGYYYNRDPNSEQLVLASVIDEDLILNDGTGFPLENGVLLIGDEVILYRYRKGNYCHDLLRGASATTILGNFLKESVYKQTEPAIHNAGDIVYNLSSLFMSAILDVIHKTYCQPMIVTGKHFL